MTEEEKKLEASSPEEPEEEVKEPEVKPNLDEINDLTKNFLGMDVKELLKDIVLEIKETVKEEVKKELIQEAEQRLKEFQEKMPQLPAPQPMPENGNGHQTPPAWLPVVAQILGGGQSPFERMMQQFFQMQLLRMMKSSVLADAAMDKVYQKILGKEFNKITKEVEKMFEQVVGGEEDGSE